MKIFAISGTETTTMSNAMMYLTWGSIAIVTAALFWGTIRMRGAHGTG